MSFSVLCIVVLVDSVWFCHYLVERASFRKNMYIIRVFVSFFCFIYCCVGGSVWYCHYLVERVVSGNICT